MRRWLGFVLGVAVLLAAGRAVQAIEPAAKSEGPPAAVVVDDPNAYSPAVVYVDIHNFAFSPQEITVEPGTTVVWRQKDAVGHDVHLLHKVDSNSLPQDIISELLTKAGDTFAVTFNIEGTYEYQCDLHPFMTGKVIVKKTS